jgi:hypothetical protein
MGGAIGSKKCHVLFGWPLKESFSTYENEIFTFLGELHSPDQIIIVQEVGTHYIQSNG